MTRIVVEKGLKSSFSSKIEDYGRLFFATDTNELGVVTSNGDIIWTVWEEEHYESYIPLADFKIEDAQIGTKVLYPDGREFVVVENARGELVTREILWGLEEGVLVNNYYPKDIEKYLGIYNYEMAPDYFPNNDNDICTIEYLERNGTPLDNTVGIDGEDRIDFDYSKEPDNKIANLGLLKEQGVLTNIPLEEPYANGIIYSPDGGKTLRLSDTGYKRFSITVTTFTSYNLNIWMETNIGIIQPTKVSGVNNTFLYDTDEKVTWFKLKGERSYGIGDYYRTKIVPIKTVRINNIQDVVDMSYAFYGYHPRYGNIDYAHRFTFEVAHRDVTKNVKYMDHTWCDLLLTADMPDMNLQSIEVLDWAWTNTRAKLNFLYVQPTPKNLRSITGTFAGTTIEDVWDIDYSKFTNFSNTWAYCSSLTSFPQLDVSNGTDFSSAWAGCTSLTSFPQLDVSNGTNFNEAWYDCTSLTSFPQLDVSNGTNFTKAWDRCSSLTSFPLLDVSNGTNFNSAWERCSSLTAFPQLDVSNGTDFSFAWYDCTSLTSFPQLDVSKGTNFRSAWEYCTSLTTFPQLDVSKGTNFGGAWSGCSSLTSFPQLDVSDGTYFESTWSGCSSLTSFPQLDVSNGTYFYGAWSGCSSLTSFPQLDVSNGTNFMYAWNDCSSLTSFPQLDVSKGISFTWTWCDCSSLTSFPRLDVSNGTDFSFTWYGCSSLTSFPLLDVSKGTGFYQAWNECSSLTSFPELDVSSGTDFRYAWRFCVSLPHCPGGNEVTIPAGANAYDMCYGI